MNEQGASCQIVQQQVPDHDQEYDSQNISVPAQHNAYFVHNNRPFRIIP